ncbi:MAG: DNA translocase FtsK 4TM domain-containing protein, partial [Rhodovibrionaceae bacterium]
MAVQDGGIAGRSRGGKDSGQRLLPAGAGAFLRRRALELLGLLLICAALLLAAACLSYTAGDPSLNNAAPGTAQNLLGLAGASAADIALQSLGFAVFPLVLVLLFWGWRLLRDGALRRAGLRLAVLPIALLLAAAALAALPDPQAWPLTSGLGGFAGDLLLGRLALLAALPAGPIALAAAPLALLLLFWLPGLTGGEWRAAGRGGARLIGGARRGVEGGARHSASGAGQ